MDGNLGSSSPKKLNNQLLAVGILFLIIIVYLIIHFSKNKPQENNTAKTQTPTETKVKIEFNESELTPFMNSPKTRTEGKALYIAKCATCHGPSGEGNIGPNLTDDFWLHGGKPHQIANSVINGIPEKGMIAWSTLLSKEEILSVSSYVAGLRGTKPPNSKGPQGIQEAP